MNQPSNHPNQTQPGTNFPSQQSSQTNPFTADLKGEFTSNFGTNTNAVSQIFKDGGFVGGSNSKMVIIGVAVVLLLGLSYFLFMGDSEEEMFPQDINNVAQQPEQPVVPAEPAQVEQPLEQVEEQPLEQVAEEPVEQAAPVEEAVPQTEPALNTGAIALGTPIDGDSRAYDETSGPAVFSWEGGGGTVVFSRSRSMTPAYMRVPVNGNSYTFYNPYPGTWYWQVVRGSDASEVRSFYVEPPVAPNMQLREPLSGSQIAGNGGVVAWTGDPKIAFYRVEFSIDGNWGNPTYRFATSGENLQVQGMNPSQYQMRIGGFSEVAGRWEYSEPVSVTVQ